MPQQGSRPQDGDGGRLPGDEADRYHAEEVARFRAMAEATAAAVTVLNPDWTVRWMNPAAADLLGCDPAKVEDRPFAELLPAPARAAHLTVERPAVARTGQWSGTEILPAPDGTRPRRLEATTQAVDHADTGERLGFVTVRRDVSVAHRLTVEHQAIGRVATAIAEGAEAEEVFATAACEAATLLDGTAGAVVALGRSGPRTMGRWSGRGGASAALDSAIPEAALHLWPDAPPTAIAAGGAHCVLAAPITVDSSLWGLVLVGRESARFSSGEAAALERLAGLVAMGVGVSRGRELLVRQATTDGLTGLSNHRTFHERLREEVKRAHRYEHPAAVVLMDLDEFKEVNDEHGHQAGDRLLRAVGGALQDVVRGTETVARLGGDEFALLLPETDLAGAVATAERVQAAVEALPEAHEHGVTVSAGVADLTQADTADELLRLADGALYWSKVHGRGRVSAYDAERVEALSTQERAERLARSHAFGAVRVLARLIDLKDTTTHHHSERVAELCVRLAAELGWPEERRGLLRDAALVHDVGKVVIPDAILAKAGPLTPDERALVEEHASMSARIAAAALGAEQVAWIAQQHERPDGTGYPARLPAAEIREGARILAFADSWDAMTSDRHYQRAKSEDDALAECRSLAGTQFDGEVIAAFERLRRASGPAADQLTR